MEVSDPRNFNVGTNRGKVGESSIINETRLTGTTTTTTTTTTKENKQTLKKLYHRKRNKEYTVNIGKDKEMDIPTATLRVV
jgi:hypothetical protein